MPLGLEFQWSPAPLTEPLDRLVVEKQLLNENNRPVKDYVGAPYRKTISPPVLKTSYDYPSLAATYLKIDGFNF